MKLTGMTAQDAIQLLEPALTKDEAGRYRLGCRKASLMVKLHGRSAPLRFGVRNGLGFRAEERWLWVEDLKTGVLRERSAREEIESLAAGEPEMDWGAPFQG